MPTATALMHIGFRKANRKSARRLKQKSLSVITEDLKPMTAWMASEDEAGLQEWLSYGCNHFDADRPEGHPMSFWTKENVLEYIRKETADIEI